MSADGDAHHHLHPAYRILSLVSTLATLYTLHSSAAAAAAALIKDSTTDHATDARRRFDICFQIMCAAHFAALINSLVRAYLRANRRRRPVFAPQAARGIYATAPPVFSDADAARALAHEGYSEQAYWFMHRWSHAAHVFLVGVVPVSVAAVAASSVACSISKETNET